MDTTKHKMKQYPKTYKVKTYTGDLDHFYQVVEVIGDMELFVKGVSRNKQDMIDLAEKLNKEAAE
jgi:hypothetical protein